MAELTRDEFIAARARGEARMRAPRAESVRYDPDRHRIVVRLTTGAEIGFAPEDAEGLQNASADDLASVEVQELGLGIHFPELDADIYIPALLQGVFGSKRWMAAQLGATGGRVRSAVKSAASRANGKRGGRPCNSNAIQHRPSARLTRTELLRCTVCCAAILQGI
jgi:hypothetical protein